MVVLSIMSEMSASDNICLKEKEKCKMKIMTRFAGTAIGFISLFSYVGVSVAGKVCGNLAQSSGGWRLPILVMVVTAAIGAALFSCLWCVRANSYAEK